MPAAATQAAVAGKQSTSIAAELSAMNTGSARPIRIAPGGKGRFSTHLGGQHLGVFRGPLFDSAHTLRVSVRARATALGRWALVGYWLTSSTSIGFPRQMHSPMSV